MSLKSLSNSNPERAQMPAPFFLFWRTEMSADVIQMKEPRRIRVQRAITEWYQAGELWIEKTLALAVELKEARKECGDNDRAFGHWLVDNDCEIGPKDRE